MLTHLDVDRADVEQAAKVLAEILDLIRRTRSTRDPSPDSRGQRRPTAGGQLADRLGEGAEVGAEQCLGAVAQRVLGVGVHVDDDAVGADGDGRPREGYDEVAAPARVRRDRR